MFRVRQSLCQVVVVTDNRIQSEGQLRLFHLVPSRSLGDIMWTCLCKDIMFSL